ncbi:Quercetin 2,3-dioxygenase [Serratia entomophila]|uniref:pirin family protein n=1 Tax=Serratia entomophila TaxID=42906 RepID=UPI002177D3B2|nr:pirin family protein [Serratia entomophila]CAI0763348.1 Quercetin 2,3-dioxygenase [Serratia entomophila]CAI1577927.1 Quercetin 2,3-dioxygenase [Serratia entomophila]CAI1582971.1 Quercetin 2,3-dioxygenase [Serratia entomophila]CAI1598348.1 Quercetin 2,3-dioxygenase [Serratia entomophila]CAI1600856.1 Quercetin 2,3-dioxygenase [Serratia entomophila]
MSNSRPTRSSSSRDCPTVDGIRQIQRIAVRGAEVGGVPIARALPTRERRTVGAWCFLDHAGPTVFNGDDPGMDVGPHPHTGLQTFTWMIEGEVLHRDSLGSEQVIRPGQVNLMTAGRGIAHTEQSTGTQRRLHAAQLWIALPAEHADMAPRFDHYPDLPQWLDDKVNHRLLIGEFGKYRSPVLKFSPLIAMDLEWQDDGYLQLPVREDYEIGLLPLVGAFELNDEKFSPEDFAYLGMNYNSIGLKAVKGSRALLIGGAPLNEEILIWWNFVGHTRQEIIQAQRDWEQGNSRFPDVNGDVGARMAAPHLPWSDV